MKFSHLHRVYTNNNLKKNQIVNFEEDNFHYLKNVLRFNKNSQFRVFNEIDGEFLCEVSSVNKHNLDVNIIEKIRDIKQEKNLTLIQSIIKQDRMLEAIRAAVQIGVTEIIPLISTRVQYKNINYKKFTNTIIQSVEQSERFSIPKLTTEMKLHEILENNNYEQIIVALESEKNSKKINSIDIKNNNIAVIIGPEGGFSEEEKELLYNSEKITTVSLGENVLRSEIATISALACIKMIM